MIISNCEFFVVSLARKCVIQSRSTLMLLSFFLFSKFAI
jgi:hypothetical protein